MGEYADLEVDREMFGDTWVEYTPQYTPKYKPSKKQPLNWNLAVIKINSIKREIKRLHEQERLSWEKARELMNKKYGKGWREKGLDKKSDNQWTEQELQEIYNSLTGENKMIVEQCIVHKNKMPIKERRRLKRERQDEKLKLQRLENQTK